jgi:hypothetical protein
VRLLLDHCVPRGIAKLLTGHSVATAAQLGWDRLRSGALLATAADAGFDALITVDRHQNPGSLRLAVIIMRARSNDIAVLSPRPADSLR